MSDALPDLFDPAAIERRIDDLLKASGTAVKRASLLTLVVAHPREQQADVACRLDYIFGKRPLRVIRIETGYNAPTAVDVTARCLPHTAGDEVCFQEIVFYSGPDGRGLEPALWEPLIIRDVPAVLYCLAGTEVLAALLRKMDFIPDKCLVDGAQSSAAGSREALDGIMELAALAERGTPVADLAWGALSGLRLLTARLFDPPETRAWLSLISRVEVTGLGPAASLYLALWLASRLGWKNGRRRGDAFSFTAPHGGSVTVGLHPDDGPHFSVAFYEASGRQAAVRQVDDAAVVLEAGTYEHRETLPPAGCDRCLLEEIDNLASDRAFLDVLAAARIMKKDA